MTLKILSLSAQTPSSPQPPPLHSPFCCRLSSSSSSSQCQEFSSRPAGIPEKRKPTFPFKIKKLQRKEKQCADLHRPRGTVHTCRGTIMGPPTAAVSPLVTFQALCFPSSSVTSGPSPTQRRWRRIYSPATRALTGRRHLGRTRTRCRVVHGDRRLPRSGLITEGTACNVSKLFLL